MRVSLTSSEIEATYDALWLAVESGYDVKDHVIGPRGRAIRKALDHIALLVVFGPKEMAS
jgi:hypothetical protein